MEKWGVEWEKTPDGKFERKEVRYKQLAAMFHGPQMMEAMTRKVISSGVEVVSHTIVTGLLTENREPGARVTGAVGFDIRTGQFKVFKAKCTILAAGGCGFKGRNACHRFQTGDASAMGYRAGATLGQFEVGGILHMTATDFSTQGILEVNLVFGQWDAIAIAEAKTLFELAKIIVGEVPAVSRVFKILRPLCKVSYKGFRCFCRKGTEILPS